MTLDELLPRTKFPFRMRFTETKSTNGLTVTFTVEYYAEKFPSIYMQSGGTRLQLEYGGRVVFECVEIDNSGNSYYFVKKAGDWTNVQWNVIENMEKDLIAQLVKQSAAFTEDFVRDVLNSFSSKQDITQYPWETF